MKYNIITNILVLLFISCVKEKKKKGDILETKHSIFLSFTFSMNDEDFKKSLESEYNNKSLLEDKFILEVLNEKLFFKISRNGGTIELKDELSRIIEPKQYTNELLNIFGNNYDKIEPLNLPINSFF